MILNKYKPVINEFLRYALIGGAAFIIDFIVLYLLKTLLFDGMGNIGILIAAAFGFICGLVFSYIFSLVFVFKQIDEKARSNKVRSFILFVIIGIAGLLITEICMYTGIILFGQKWYLVVKAFAAGIVLLWNYFGRKVFIFKGAGLHE